VDSLTRLLSIAFTGLPRPFQSTTYVDLANPPAQLLGWQICVRGAAVFLVSPAGWQQGKSAKGTDRKVLEAPRAKCDLTWAIDDVKALDKDIQRYDSPVLERAARVRDEDEPVIDAKEVGDE
jgi:hypothetical protein